jgi:hypothetical protein
VYRSINAVCKAASWLLCRALLNESSQMQRAHHFQLHLKPLLVTCTVSDSSMTGLRLHRQGWLVLVTQHDRTSRSMFSCMKE